MREELGALLARPDRRAARAVHRSPAVRHRRSACRGGRRPAADEPAGGAAGRCRPRRLPAGQRARRRRGRVSSSATTRAARATCSRSTRLACARPSGVKALLFPHDRAHAGAGVEHHRGRRRRRRDGHRLAQPAGRQRLQGVPRHRLADRAAGRHRHLRRASTRSTPRPSSSSPPDDPLITVPRRASRSRPTWRSVPAVRLLPRHARRCRSPTRRCTAWAAPRWWPRSSVRACPRRRWWPQQQQPDGTFPTVSFPNPEEPGAMDLLMAQAADVGAHDRPRQRPRRRPHWARPSPRPRAAGVVSAATRSAGCWPTTSCATPRATTAW